jgi:hypothetical protein
VKYVVRDSFKADYRRLSKREQALFKNALPDFVAACDRYAANPWVAWPASLRVKDVESAPGILEMTWSFSGPDGRATFEWAKIGGQLRVRWRRIGGHSMPPSGL